ncbi:carbohydrate ABC transporter permease [Anaerocolumna sp. MB42-C2]|uniref:carbohydrate ABC transporter permease n=1 Tax=Anaerocolumna sp. MB42-C2 TaxID=3070997 RepID=UPI0027E1CAE9|nr:sugar ABC transporter permease [Anaerocolumna sp. MB42-C2]WMJ87698.1 sugar ABC transporter permease [Anaerocolumna sp. MB42-C2]
MEDKKKQRKKKYHIKKVLWAFFFLTPSLTGTMLFLFLPFLDAAGRSFYTAVGREFVGVSNYLTVLQNSAFHLAVKNTVRFILICIPLLLLISLFYTAVVSSLKKYAQAFKTLFLIPIAIPAASIVFLWKIFFHQSGMVNLFVIFMGGQKIDFMNTGRAFWVLVFSYIWKNTGYDMVLWLAGLAGIPVSYYEAAKIDGAGALAQFYYITLSELRPTIYITAVLSLVNSFKVFREAYLVGGNYPQDSIYMLQHIFNNWFISLDIQKMCAAAVMMAGVILLFLLLLRKIDRNREE